MGLREGGLEPQSSLLLHSMEGFTPGYRKRGRNLQSPTPTVRFGFWPFNCGPQGMWVEGVPTMRQDRTIRRGVRANALWGRRGESRSNALWGSGKRGMIMLALAAMLIVPMAGSASSGDGKGGGAIVPNSLL